MILVGEVVIETIVLSNLGTYQVCRCLFGNDIVMDVALLDIMIKVF
jgi:hypothetical protein